MQSPHAPVSGWYTHSENRIDLYSQDPEIDRGLLPDFTYWINEGEDVGAVAIYI